MPFEDSGRATQPARIIMNVEGPDRQQQKINEFLRLLPLTLAIAGLPNAEPGKHLNEGQMEVRAADIRNAYKFARQVILEIAK
jgi:hypothetical protein